ncbi:hypothetical protein LOK49_LG12G00485 [Camellia lanceoleosa]|uniref:Uncharacterized protein n=1 Tax=Camellia lanceoleosa TaxID=1840588 RepID=A0ACC0FYM7_9ERIC|nr:hypothetical protein LOK49_LG12G00485 [Camellia lanceoleosa]
MKEGDEEEDWPDRQKFDDLMICRNFLFFLFVSEARLARSAEIFGVDDDDDLRIRSLIKSAVIGVVEQWHFAAVITGATNPCALHSCVMDCSVVCIAVFWTAVLWMSQQQHDAYFTNLMNDGNDYELMDEPLD